MKKTCSLLLAVLLLMLGCACGKSNKPITAAELAPGDYTAEVTLTGGTGKATVSSPAALTVTPEGITAVIRWSSANYDYMVVNGERYLPVTVDPVSVFEIPVEGLNMPLTVIADTVAMSTPHEIEYTLTFDGATLAKR